MIVAPSVSGACLEEPTRRAIGVAGFHRTVRLELNFVTEEITTHRVQGYDVSTRRQRRFRGGRNQEG